MKLEDARNAYEALSAKASEIVRQLSLAGIALIWLFRSGSSTSPVLELPLLRAALFIFLALLLDFLQYLTGTTVWFLYFRKKEKNNVSATTEFGAPASLNVPMWIMFYTKSVCMTVAYAAYLIPFLLRKFVA